MTATQRTAAQIRRRDPVFRTASALVLLIGLEKWLISFPILPQPIGALRAPEESIIRILLEGLAAPLACVICGALMLLRGSVGAAVLVALVAFADLVAVGVAAALSYRPVLVSAVVLGLLVIVMGVCATVRAAQLVGAEPPAGPGATPTRVRGLAFLTASAVLVFAGVVELLAGFPTFPGPELGTGRVPVTVWLVALYVAQPAAYLTCAAMMLLRRSVSAVVFAVLVASLDLLVLVVNVMRGYVPPVLPVLLPLLVVVAGIWAVRAARSPV